MCIRDSSGASNDIEQATRIARSMITRLGMSETFGMIALETVNNKYLGGDTSLACSDQTAARVDEEVRRLIPVSYTHLDVYKRQASCCLGADD